MFLIETPDKNILHTGDYRDHGHRGHKIKNGQDMNVMLEVIKCYVRDYGRRKINTLITEGTMMGARKNDRRYSEKMMLQDAKKLFRDHRYVFLKISSTNADSLATFYHAAMENGMRFYANKYVLMAKEEKHPDSKFRGHQIFRKSNKERIKAFFLVPSFHPFIKDQIDHILKEMNKKNDIRINYGYIEFSEDEIIKECAVKGLINEWNEYKKTIKCK